MALIICPECGKEISDRATACIYCGYPISAMIKKNKKVMFTATAENLDNNEPFENADKSNKDKKNCVSVNKKRLKSWHKIFIVIIVAILLGSATAVLFNVFSQESVPPIDQTPETLSNEISTTIIENSVNDYSNESLISNGRFIFSAYSFIKRFDDVDKEAKGYNYNYTYMRLNGETSLFYELAEISGGYEKVKSVGLVSFTKDIDTTLAIEENDAENIITKINVLVKNIDDVPPILVGCICAVDPTLDFSNASDLGSYIVKKSGTKDGYVHNGIRYIVTSDSDYYYIIVSVENTLAEKEVVTSNPSFFIESTYSKLDNTTATLTATETDLFLDGTSELVYFYVNPSNIDAIVDYTIADESVVEIQRGGWGGNTAQLLFIPVSTGETTVTVYIEGYEGCSVEINVSSYVDDAEPSEYDFKEPFITSTESEFWLENENGITYITAYDVIGEYSVSCEVDNEDVVQCVWGEWDGDTISLTFIPKGSGNAFVTIYIDGYYDSSAITIPVFVE